MHKGLADLCRKITVLKPQGRSATGAVDYRDDNEPRITFCFWGRASPTCRIGSSQRRQSGKAWNTRRLCIGVGRKGIDKYVNLKNTFSKELRKIRRGWCFGDEAFRKELLEQMGGGFGPEHYGEERREGEQERAERLVREGLKKARWDEDELGQARKGDPVKVELARRLRVETTMSYEWIANRLRMGSKSNVSNLVYDNVRKPRKWKK